MRIAALPKKPAPLGRSSEPPSVPLAQTLDSYAPSVFLTGAGALLGAYAGQNPGGLLALGAGLTVAVGADYLGAKVGERLAGEAGLICGGVLGLGATTWAVLAQTAPSPVVAGVLGAIGLAAGWAVGRFSGDELE